MTDEVLPQNKQSQQKVTTVVPIRYEKKNKKNAQNLRKNMTQEERALWYRFLKTYPHQFRRQKQFGRYIADFYCAEAMLVVEIDGSQHYTDEGKDYDRERTAYLEGLGLRILRITNRDVNEQFRAVCEEIDSVVKERC